MTTYRTIGERIRQAREAKHMSQAALAQAVGYETQSGISNLEGRKDGSGGRRLPRIAQVLDVAVEWLLSGPDSETVPFLSQQGPGASTPYAVSSTVPGSVNQRSGVWAPSVREVVDVFNELLPGSQSEALSFLQFLRARDQAARRGDNAA